jgi:hypothetical protein
MQKQKDSALGSATKGVEQMGQCFQDFSFLAKSGFKAIHFIQHM